MFTERLVSNPDTELSGEVNDVSSRLAHTAFASVRTTFFLHVGYVASTIILLKGSFVLIKPFIIDVISWSENFEFLFLFYLCVANNVIFVLHGAELSCNDQIVVTYEFSI